MESITERTRLEQIRKAERESHTEIYEQVKLYERGTWLQSPVRTVLELLPMLEGRGNVRVLDLGSGVGRNSIPVAKHFREMGCTVECVDLLGVAIREAERKCTRTRSVPVHSRNCILH